MTMLDMIISILSFFPVIGLATLGGLITQKSGVWNIAIEGMMAFGTFAGVFGYHYLGRSLFNALLFGFLGGLMLGGLLALLCVRLGLDQIVVGFGLWFLGEGLSGFMYSTIVPSTKIEDRLPQLLLSLDPVFYVSILGFAGLYIVLRYMKAGLAIIATGEDPKVADSAGIDVYKIRWLCTVLGSGIIGLAGAYLSIAVLQGFSYRMVAGYGWAAFALILFGRWEVPGSLLGSLLFTFLVGAQTRLQIAGVNILPPTFMVVIPQIGVLLAVAIGAVLGKKAGMPSALGVHYGRE